MENIDRNIFREYDIRGVAGKDLTEEVAFKIGKAFATMALKIKAKTLALAYDIRLSSPSLSQNLMKGIISTGLNVLNLGVCPTPLLYFALHQLDVDGGVMITGSHNPPEYNGLKLCLGKETIYGEKIQEVRRIIEEEKYLKGEGKIEDFQIIPKYIQYIEDDFKDLTLKDYRLKVVIDCGNGTAGLVVPEILRRLNCEVVELYTKPDGNFPNHHPDPTIPEYLKDLIEKTKEVKADVGIGYDGDADRIGVIDEKGEIIWGDKLLILFSREILKNNPKSVFISEVKSSQLLYDDIIKNNGIAIMWKTGHSLIKAKMKKEKAALAGEMSGHMFFADRYFGFDDAIYTTCRLIEVLKNNKKSLSSLLSDLPKTFNTPEIRVDCPDDLKFKIVEDIKKKLRDNYEIIDIDGVRVKFSDGWGLIRASNTQPVLVLRFEANSQKRLFEIKKMLESLLSDIFKVYGREIFPHKS